MEHVNEITLEEKLKSAQGREKVSSSFKTRGNCCKEEIVFGLLIFCFFIIILVNGGCFEFTSDKS